MSNIPDVLAKKYTITDPQNQASDIDDLFDDLYRQLTDAAPTGDAGDIFIADEDGEFVGLALGTNGAFLRAGTDLPEWSTLILPNTAVKGDILYASAADILSRLADVATGNALISGGVGLAPSWGKIDLTAHISGILPVANGGTARASHTAYAVICGGTTGTGAQQSIASVGTSGQVLTSNGAAALPTFQTAAGGGTPTFQTTTSTGTQNDFSLTAAYTLLRCNNASQVDFTGFSIAGNVANEGDRCIVIAINSTVTLAHQNAGSNPLLRMITSTAGTLTLTTGQWAEMIYDGTTARWRVTNVGGSSSSVAGADTQVIFNDAGAYAGDAGLVYNKTTDSLTLAGLLNLSGASAGQISFPASQNSSAGANVFDDYEEGTWTPAITGGGGTSGQTYGAQVGRYQKFAKLVVLTGYVILSNKGTITGAVQLSGFPFALANVANYFSAGSTAYSTLATNNVVVNIEAVNNQTYAFLYFKTAASLAPAALVAADITNATDIEFSIMYEAQT